MAMKPGGGTLRIFDQNIQKKIFNILGLSDEGSSKKSLATLLTPYNTELLLPMVEWPSDLTALAMILGDTDNIRDVIAFPKNLLSAVCPMTNAPTKVSEDQAQRN